MSGIARMYLASGFSVQGSDLKKTEILEPLESAGARIFVGHGPANLDGADLVVYSSSIKEDHVERAEARRRGLKIVHRAEALAEICKDKFTIAVTGTHGKTTTTALVGMVLREAGRDPSIVVGGIVASFGGNAVCGRGREIVIEADESDSSFLNFSPSIEIITNIEKEHMDHFQTLDKVEDAYRAFIRRLVPGGEWFGCADDATVLRFSREASEKNTLYGLGDSAPIRAADIIECPGGTRGVSFSVWSDGRCLGPVRMKIIGRHNVLNALAAAAVGLRLGIRFETIAEALGKYEGTGRRFDIAYEDSRFLVVDDYAHHPTEIKNTLFAARALKRKRIVALFQPHRYTRTEVLLQDFAGSFGDADKLIVTDIYAASEMPRPGVSGDALCRVVREAGHPSAVFVERDKVVDTLRAEMRPGDLVIAMGAGDIYRVAMEISDGLRAREAGGIFSRVRGKVKRDELLSKHTSLKVGGPVDYWMEPEDSEDLKEALRACCRRQIPVFAFGLGSNLLPPDEGLRAAAIHLSAPFFKRLEMRDGKIVAGAGVPNSVLMPFALEHGFGGFEFLLGIPGNVGGAVAMNAGSHGESVDSIVDSVRVIGLDGEERLLKRREIPFRYRGSGLRDSFIVEASFLLPRADRTVTERKMGEYHNYRARTQDLWHPSAGCMFKNPEPPGLASGRLIELAGFKGKRMGNAQVSEKHANFIVNLGGAASGDVKRLIEEVRAGVAEKFGVKLETEVEIL